MKTRSYLTASDELVEQMGVDPQDIVAMQQAFLLDQLGLTLLEVKAEPKRVYRLTVEGENLPPEGGIVLEYERGEDGKPRLVRWR